MLLLLMVLELSQLLKKLLLVVAVGVFAGPRLCFFLIFTGGVSSLPAEEIFSAEQPGPFGKPALGWSRLWGLQLPSSSSSFNRWDRRQRWLLLEATVDSQHWRSCHALEQAHRSISHHVRSIGNDRVVQLTNEN